MAKRVKAALIRDPSVPAGQPAPLHVVCDCGHHVPITHECPGELNVCLSCGTAFDDNGWIRGGPKS
jgi:hypothetical protein